MRNPETTRRHRSSRRAGPGSSVLAGLFTVLVGMLVALRGAYLVASAIGPAGAIHASPALSGLVLLVFGALVECVGVGVFSKRLVTMRVVQPAPAAASFSSAVLVEVTAGNCS